MFKYFIFIPLENWVFFFILESTVIFSYALSDIVTKSKNQGNIYTLITLISLKMTYQFGFIYEWYL